MRRDGDTWHVTTHETGNLDDALTSAGHPASPLPGIDDPDRLNGIRDLHVSTVPLTLTPLIHRTQQARDGQPITVTAAYILTPSLTVIPATETMTMVDQHTLNLSRGGHTAAIDIDDQGLLTHYPGIVRRVN